MLKASSISNALESQYTLRFALPMVSSSPHRQNYVSGVMALGTTGRCTAYPAAV
ncbi:hypothetical protein PSPO01_07131 [Paraphaeosphaeria sporulosa]